MNIDVMNLTKKIESKVDKKRPDLAFPRFR